MKFAVTFKLMRGHKALDEKTVEVDALSRDLAAGVALDQLPWHGRDGVKYVMTRIQPIDSDQKNS
jgi:hypothetical protein